MNYQKLYDSIIFRDRTREVFGYVERHHIIPKSMGGSDKKENIVKLTAKEHFVAHHLLYKIHKNAEMTNAFYIMTHGKIKSDQERDYIVNSRLYERIKIEFSILQSKRMMGVFAGRILSEEHKEKISKKLSGRISPNLGNKYTEEQKARCKKSQAANKANLGKTFSDETKLKMSIAKKGKPKSDEHKANMKIAQQKRRGNNVN